MSRLKACALSLAYYCALLGSFVLTDPAQAAIIIDPLNAGATDVSPSPPGVIPDPWFVAGSVAVGNTASGALEINGGSDTTSDNGFVGVNHGSTGVATVTGAGSTWTNTGILTVGNLGNGTLNVMAGGGVSNANGNIGFFAGSTGVVKVTGAATWTNTSSLNVGLAGNGTLNVEAGGGVSNASGDIGLFAGSTGVVNVADSTWTNTGSLNVGQTGNGKLNVMAGGAVSNTTGTIGRNLGSTGVATITGPGSTWTNTGDLIVGEFGNGTLNVAGGAVSNTTTGYIGRTAGSIGVVTVKGADSTWINTGSLTVGNQGTGTLNVEAGGTVSNTTTGYIGRTAGSIGVVTVTGPGSTWTNASNLTVGNQGSGTLNILDGGEVEAGGTLSIGAAGRVTLDGGALSVASLGIANGGRLRLFDGTFNLTSANLHVGAGHPMGDTLSIQSGVAFNVTNATTIETDGTLDVIGQFISGGGLTNLGDLVLIDTTGLGRTFGSALNTPAGSAVTLVGDTTFTAAVSGAGNFYGPGTATFAGGYSPGDSPAVVSFEGNVVLNPANVLNIELGGLQSGQFDRLTTAGDLWIDGLLSVSLMPSFTLDQGQQFEILAAAGLISGTFANLPQGAWFGNLGGTDLFITYGSHQVTLFTAPVPEPSSLILLGTGAVAMGALVLRRRARAS